MTGDEPVSYSEEQGRAAKVGALVAALLKAGADLEYVTAMTPVEWALASHAADVRHPSDRTKALVLVQFEALAKRTPPEEHGPHLLDGLPQ